MNKFFAILFALSLSCFASPAFAESASLADGWSGTFKVQQQDGSYLMSDRSKGGPRLFEECKRFSSGHAGAGTYCRGDVKSGGGNSTADTRLSNNGDSGNCRNTSSTTCYAVFNPKTYRQYVSSGGNIWNTESEPQMVAVCQQAGSHCTFQEAPLHDYATANNLVKDRTGWRLQRL